MTICSYDTTLLKPKPNGALFVDRLINPDLTRALVTKDVDQKGYGEINSPSPERLLAAVAHDLRNPLGASYSLLSILMDDEELKDEQREILTMLKETTRHSLNLVNGLLKTYKDKNETTKTDIREVITRCASILKTKAAIKNQLLYFHCGNEPEIVNISEDDIRRVLMNLVSNAIKFTPVGGTITVELSSTANDTMVSVQDNGIGIPHNLHHKIFNDNDESGREGTHGEESFGLGLSICRRLIQEHGGKIDFTSIPLKGSIFYFTLPKLAV